MEITVTGDLIFRNNKSFQVYFKYDEQKETFSNMIVTSNLSCINKSDWDMWMDESSYGLCTYHANKSDLLEIANTIVSFDWMCNKKKVNDATKKKILAKMISSSI